MQNQTAGVPTQQIEKILRDNKVYVCGNLTPIHTFKDGAVLMADVVIKKQQTFQRKFFKVSDCEIKLGKFKKNRFHYNTKNGVIKISSIINS